MQVDDLLKNFSFHSRIRRDWDSQPAQAGCQWALRTRRPSLRLQLMARPLHVRRGIRLGIAVGIELFIGYVLVAPLGRSC